MVFTSPEWVPKLPFDVPDSVSIPEFMLQHGPPTEKCRNPFTCGITGKTYTAAQVLQRVDFLARAIAKKLAFNLAEGTEWDRVVGLFSVNTIDYVPLTHAVHRNSAIVTPASAAYSAAELEHQLRTAGATSLFTCLPLLETALKAAEAVGIPHDRIFLLPVPGATEHEKKAPFKTVDDLIEEGEKLPELPPLRWVKGQGERQVAYLCFSSGTSGLPKAVMISHRNVIANVFQNGVYNTPVRAELKIDTQVMLGLLPFSHIYGLVPVAHTALFAGDEVIVLPKFELPMLLKAIERFRIEQTHVVPPILIQLITHKALCAKHDLSSLRVAYSGAAPCGSELVEELNKAFPRWTIAQGYGLTETSPVVVSTSELDLVNGSSGSLLPGLKAKLVDPEGREITAYDTPGELLVQGPSVVLGYLNNEKATAETFIHDQDGRWIRTGDEVVVRKAPSGNEHFTVVDRIKELIKVKGNQVAPAELEAHILAHPDVSDCAVIQVPDRAAGEVPKAFVVKAAEASGKSDEEITKSIHKFVEEHKARHKWLKGGIEFIEEVPKSPSGKILRRLLRDEEKRKRKQEGAKL